MYLEKLKINGFKSFANKSKLDFKEGITAIVGPNGSGKSNISDAMRWVLGEQSLKLLRGKKSEDVIFSGSDKKTRLGMAEVSLYFNNEKDETGLGLSEIIITRRVHRNGESEYILNNKKCRLIDIHLLLAQAGIARTSYSIIGQGMIDSFLLSSPQDRRDFFEDASGVRSLQMKKLSSINKLSSTEENLETATIHFEEITPRLNSLTRQVKKLEQRKELEETIKILQKKYFTSVWQDIKNKWQTIKDNLDQKTIVQEEIKQKVFAIQKKISLFTKEKNQSEKLINLQLDYQQFVNQKIKLSEESSNLKIKTIQTAQKIVAHSNVPHETATQIISFLDETLKLKNTIKENIEDQNYLELEENISKQNIFLEKINILIEPFKDKTEKIDNSEVEAENKIINEKSILIQKEIKDLDESIKKIELEIQTETHKEKEERSEIWQHQQAYQEEQSNLNQLSNEVNNYRVELARIETKKEDLERDIREDFGSLEEIKSQEIIDLDQEERTKIFDQINKIKNQLNLIGGIDPEIKKEYEDTKSRFDFLSVQTDDLKKSILSLEKMINNLDVEIKNKFDHNFKIINQEFQKHFKTLFDGGRANLILLPNTTLKEKDELEEEDQPENKTLKSRLNTNPYAGIDIEATPPGKKLKSINMLSGGERAMTSIALLCAILSANPSPFVVLDEVDAALDEANSIRYANIIADLSSKSQFIIITHNRATMEKAHTLYGVTMGNDGVSKLLSIQFEKATEYTNR
jgi:chromosome segregation ATPase